MKISVVAAALALVAGAAIAVPNYLNARNRTFQKRTMADLRSISTALVEYEKDHPAYPLVSIYALEPFLVPEYVHSLPTVDEWGKPLEYVSDGRTFELRSWGSDGVREMAPKGGKQAGFEFDLIIRGDQFWQFPHGL